MHFKPKSWMSSDFFRIINVFLIKIMLVYYLISAVSANNHKRRFFINLMKYENSY